MEEQSRVLSLLETLVFNWKLHQGRDMVCRAWLMEILLMLLAKRPSEKTGRERERHLALRVKDILDQSIFKNETIKGRLEQLECGYEHLSRVFYEYFSMTMVGYLNRVRLENAKRMFESRKFRVSEVAYKLGYNTPVLSQQLRGHKFNRRLQRWRMASGGGLDFHGSHETLC